MKKEIIINRKKLTILIAIILILSLSLGYMFGIVKGNKELLFGDNSYIFKKLGVIDKIVKDNYIGKTDKNELETKIMSAYMDGINDKYAEYYTSDEWQQKSEENKGELIGIGLTSKLNKNHIPQVVEVYKNSPAEKNGIKVGDQIIKINGNETKGKDINEVTSMLRGEEGSEVNITIIQDKNETDKNIIRERVEIPAVEYELRDNIGYIKISTFIDIGAKQFKSALDDLEQNEAKGLIIDLRNNGGGTLNSVSETLSYILPEGTIGTEEKVNGEKEELGHCDGKNEINLPMVVLTNEYTASASELFVCDLKDYNKAKLVGEKTYGKGVLQTTIMLSDKSAVKMTTAYFNPAKSENFNGKGIEPDYKVSIDEGQKARLMEGNLDYNEDNQYLKGIEVLKGLI